MDEGPLVCARVDAEQPVAVVRRDAAELEPGHGVAALLLVDDEVGVEGAGTDHVDAHVVIAVADGLYEIHAVAVIADCVELELAAEVDAPRRRLKRGIGHEQVRR